MNFLGMGSLEILLVFFIAFIFLGPERMVEVGRTLGKTLRQLQRFSTDFSKTVINEEDLNLLERPLVHQRGARGHFETESNPQGESETDGQAPVKQLEEPVSFSPSSENQEKENLQQPPNGSKEENQV